MTGEGSTVDSSGSGSGENPMPECLFGRYMLSSGLCGSGDVEGEPCCGKRIRVAIQVDGGQVKGGSKIAFVVRAESTSCSCYGGVFT